MFGGRHPLFGLGSLLEILLGSNQSVLRLGKPIGLHVLADTRGPGFDGQANRDWLLGKMGQELGRTGQDPFVLDRVGRIAAPVNVRGRVGFVVVNPGQSSLGKIGFTRQRIETHMVRFEDGPEPVIVLVANRVVFVVVTLGTVHRQAKQRFTRMFNRVIQPGRPVEQVVVAGQEAGCRQGLQIARGDLVAGDHFHDHPIVAFILVERIDNPLPPMPNMLLTVAQLGVQSIPVAVSPDVHPVSPPTFPVLRAIDQPVNQRFDRLVRLQLVDRGWQPNQVEVESPDQQASRRSLLQLELIRFLCLGQKGIDRVGLTQLGYGRAFDF